MVFVSLCNRLQQIEFKSMLRFLFVLANKSLLLCEIVGHSQSEPMYLPLRGCKRGGDLVLIENSVPFICPRTWFSFERRWGFFYQRKVIFSTASTRGQETQCATVKWSIENRTIISIASLLVGFDELCVIYPSTPYFWKCGWNAMTNALVVLYLLLSVCTSLQSETGKLWFCCFHSQNVKIFYANYVDLHCIWSGLTGIPSL